MAENSGFFDARLVDGEYDRVYLAEQFAKYFASFIGNGIFGGKSNELMVRQKDTADMSIKVLTGQGWINGYWYENTDELPLTISNADGVLNRIDVIVLRWFKTERVIRLTVLKGTSASSPSAPVIIRSEDYYDLKLAEIYVKAGATSITQENITDTRLNKSVCGLVQGVIQQFDTTEFGKQIDSFIENFEASNIAKINEVLKRLNDIADENDIANLVLGIDNLKLVDLDIKSKIAIVNQTLGFLKKNMLPSPFYVKTFTSNGITFTDNGDGSFTVNGTATANSYYTLYRGRAFDLGKYLVSSNHDVPAKHYTYIRFISRQNSLEIEGTTQVGYENTPIEVTQSEYDNYDLFVGFAVTRGTTVSNLIVRPMVRSAEINDKTWELYTKSVKERFDSFAIEDEVYKGCYYRINPLTNIKEWINPPMEFGVEYCTTEKYRGEPVYIKMIYAASLPNNSTMSINTQIPAYNIVSIEGRILDTDENIFHPIPFSLPNQTIATSVISSVEYDGELLVYSALDTRHCEGYFTIKYRKP